MMTGTIHAARNACAALFAIAALALTAPTHAQCVGDINGSGNTDGVDLAVLLVAWGTSGQGQYDADLSNDGSVGGSDLSILLSSWGPCAVVPSWATLIEAQPNPEVVTDPSLRAAITATGYAWRVRDTATQIEMMLIPPGTFQMGCSASQAYGCYSDENPVHTVTLTNAFYIGRYEVTQSQWQARMGSNPSSFQSASTQVPAAQVPNRPVETVSWSTIQGFLAQTGMRLPTEAEWEYAYRAGTTTAFHGFAGNLSGTNDDTLVGNIAWYNANSNSQTRPVGGKLANGYGLHDMSGNVWEWVNDWWSSTYYASGPQNNPTGPASGTSRVVRGGSLIYSTGILRASTRNFFMPFDTSGNFVGFRVARDPQAQPPALTSIAPTSGYTTGGTLITLTGTNLSGATSVTVGGVAATSVQLVSPTTVTAITPAGTAGAKSVSVTTAGGTATLANAFTYGAPTVPSWATLIEQLPDPAVVTDANLRAAITATGYAWRVRDTATQIEMMLIPPGSFQMGCSASLQYGCYNWENPVHTVTLTNAFYMGRYEVTQAQWQARMGSNPSYFQSASTQVPAAQVPNRPVERVSWNTIQGFLAQTGMRLPTEAEWEYAYRAGTTTAFHGFAGNLSGTNDDSLVGNIAWYGSNSNNQTRPVGGKLANGYGLHDMSGNVWEWVSDWYGNHYYASSPQNNPTGPASGTSRVVRGGSWDGSTDGLRASYRYGSTPDNAGGNFGFRVARAP